MNQPYTNRAMPVKVVLDKHERHKINDVKVFQGVVFISERRKLRMDAGLHFDASPSSMVLSAASGS